MTVSVKVEELKWIQEDVIPLARPEDDFTPQKTRKTFAKRLTDNIIIPCGLVATATCLLLGLHSMSRGDSAKQQFFMRGRVGFQAFTFIAMTTGVALTAAAARAKVDPETNKSENK